MPKTVVRAAPRLVPLMLTWAFIVVATAAAWHLYEVTQFCIVAVTAGALATLVSWLLLRFRPGFLVAAMLVVLVAFTGAVATAAPTLFSVESLLNDPGSFVRHLGSIAIAPITGWKDLLTLELPLGSYQTVLAPYFYTVFGCSLGALLLSARGSKRSVFAPVLALIMPLFGLVLGSSVVRPIEQAVTGCVAFVLALGWLVWRSADARRASLAQAGATVRGRSLGRSLAGVVVIALAGGAGVLVSPSLTAAMTRDVPRAVVHPELETVMHSSPLSAFRQYREADSLDRLLFTVEAPQSIERVRIATLDHYDGVTMRAASDHEQFRRVASTVPRGDASLQRAEITMAEYDMPWVPLAGDLVAIDFQSPKRAALSDAFFYQPTSGSGVELAAAGFEAGDRLIEQVAQSDAVTLSTAQPSRAHATYDETVVPESLKTWVNDQNVAKNGAGFVELLERLRARGFLSHSIVQGEASAAWMQQYGVTAFEPSRAGHSTARIDRLFSDLNTRQAEAGAASEDEDLVAAVGDDEQFAVAAALMADQLGFDTRVVLGVTLVPGEHANVPSCELGACTGSNLTAWLEVRDAATGTWVTADVTPQHEVAPKPEATLTSDPKHATEVLTPHGETIAPPEATPGQQGAAPEKTDAGPKWWHALLGPLRVTAIAILALLVLAAPLIMVGWIKRRTLRAQRHSGGPSQRVVSGWNALVDTALDYGAPRPTTETRTEYASVLGGDEVLAQALAAYADEAAFGFAELSEQGANDYWEQIDEARNGFAISHTRRERLRAYASTRSIRAAIAREVDEYDQARAVDNDERSHRDAAQ